MNPGLRRLCIWAGAVLVVLSLFYVSGWRVWWGMRSPPIITAGLLMEGVDPCADSQVNGRGVVFRVDAEWYGLVVGNRFFYSPFLAWTSVVLSGAVVAIARGFVK